MNTSLKALQLKAKYQVHTLLSGHSLSTLHGEGYEFSELREYQVGDDIRKINWMITAKLGKPYIKELQSNRELSIVVATFMDASLYFGSGNSKQKKLTEVATLLGYASVYQNDLFTGISYTQEKIYATPPTKQVYMINMFIKTLFEASLLQSNLSFKAAIEDLFSRVTRPSLLFVMSDFLEEVDLSLLAQKHEVIAIIIRDKEEDLPKKLADITLENPKNLTQVKTHFGKRNIEKYLKNLQTHDEKLIKHFSHYGIRHIKIGTDDDVIQKLLLLFT